MEREEIYTRRILTILKLDAERLYMRLKEREAEYLHIFSQKRSRDHFKEVFKSRYDLISPSDLKFCSEDVIMALEAYYRKIDDMRWYLYHTEDMPISVDDNVRVFLRELKALYNTLSLFINAELQVGEQEQEDDILDDYSQEYNFENQEGDDSLEEFTSTSFNIEFDTQEENSLVDIDSLEFGIEEDVKESIESNNEEDKRSPSKNLNGEDTLLGVFNKDDLKDLK